MDALDNFYTDHPFVDWYKQPKMKDILSIFQKGLFFGLDDYQFWEYRFTQIYCKSLRVNEWLDQKWVGIHFLFLSKNYINSVLKIPVANFCHLITLQIHLLGKPGMWPPEISIVYGLLIQLFLYQSLKCFWNCVLV